MKKKLFIINEKDFEDLKKVWKNGAFYYSSNSVFFRCLISELLNLELKK